MSHGDGRPVDAARARRRGRPSGADDGARRRTVQSVERSLDLLEALADREEAALGELAAQAGLLPSTAHRLLATLVRRGYAARQPDTGRYVLGYKALELSAQAGQRHARVRGLARPHLERIRTLTGETVNLVFLDGPRVVYVDQVEGLRGMRMFTEIGREVPAHTTAAGKAMLAFQPRAAELGAASLRLGGGKLTARTITTPEALAVDLERVRGQGFAVDDEEHEEGVVCVGAPVFDHAGEAVAALSVSGPAARMRRPELGEIVRSEAAELSRTLARERAG